VKCREAAAVVTCGPKECKGVHRVRMSKLIKRTRSSAAQRCGIVVGEDDDAMRDAGKLRVSYSSDCMSSTTACHELDGLWQSTTAAAKPVSHEWKRRG
jgi:hypothetical protein